MRPEMNGTDTYPLQDHIPIASLVGGQYLTPADYETLCRAAWAHVTPMPVGQYIRLVLAEHARWLREQEGDSDGELEL